MKSTIEPHHSHDEIAKSSERSFGIVFSLLFLIIGLFPLLSGNNIRLWSLIVAVAFFVVALGFPRILCPLNALWFKFGILLGKIMSPIILGLVFLISIVPIGLIMRGLGKDILNIRLDKTKESYWIDRTPSGPKKESMKNQF